MNTNAPSGYQITILADGHLRKTTAAVTTTAANEIIARISDGTVSANGNEYGYATSSTDLAIPTSTPSKINGSATFARKRGHHAHL